jgi:Na+-transporting methylmalonyl-CoA/oxaloacetate decarboxylase gamma subunit
MSARLSGQGRKRFARHQQSEKHNQEREESAVKPVTLVGVVLIVLGILALAYQGITYTTREKVVDLGPLKITADKEKSIPLPPILGALALAGGVVLVIVGARKS